MLSNHGNVELDLLEVNTLAGLITPCPDIILNFWYLTLANDASGQWTPFVY